MNEKEVVQKMLAMGAESLNPDAYAELESICGVLSARREALMPDFDLSDYSEESIAKYADREVDPNNFGAIRVGGSGNTEKDEIRAVIGKVVRQREGVPEEKQTIEWWTSLYTDVIIEVLTYLRMNGLDRG